MSEHTYNGEHPVLQRSGTYTPDVMEDIHTKAALGRYRIRGFGTLRERRWPTFDDQYVHPPTWWQHFPIILQHLTATGEQ